MKRKLYYSVVWIFSALIFLGACKKDNTPTPDPTPDPEPTMSLFESIQGKWNINNASGRIVASKLLSGKVQDQRTLVSLEFLSDSTYIITFGYGEIYSGKIKMNDSTTINLGELGIVNNIQFSGETSLSFNISSEGWGSFTVVTTKAPKIAETTETALICKKWAITTTDMGPAIFNLYGSGEEYPLHLLFTKSGTYYVSTSHLDTIYNALSCTWKWHPSKAKTFIYSNEGKDNEVTIIELTETSLKMEEDYIDEWSQAVHKEYFFVPVK